MAFTVPTFNLTCDVWHAGALPPAPADASFLCNLAFGKRVSSYQGVISTPNEPIMSLLLPPGADIRFSMQGVSPDLVEVPAGSGRFYLVVGVDDIGKGFLNEHRCALLAWTTAAGLWPIPLP